MLTTSKFKLAADLVAGGAITVGYPAGVDGGHLSPAGHKISIVNGANLLQGRDFAITINKVSAVITLAAGQPTILKDADGFVEFQIKGRSPDIDVSAIAGSRLSRRQPVEVNFGQAAAPVANGYVASQALTALGVFSVNAAAAAAIAAASLAGVADVPRNVVAAWTGTAILTITGLDEYGNVIVESSASGTSLAGKKAFKRITNIRSNADITGLTVGTGNVLGLPTFLPNAANILYETQDNAAASAGTRVAGDLSKPTATTGDVRGTIVPAVAPDGLKKFSVVFLADDPQFLGVPQFAG